jgi:glycopeptide antibiotics resistance protein
MISNNESHHQLRRTYFIGVIITVLLGLASRKFGYLLFSFLAENAGDVLWAMMVYFGFRFLFLKKSMLTAILLSLLFSFSIEFSQLYQEEWINQIRGTLLGALILGKGFLLVDLIRYTAGIVIASSLDRLIIKKKQRNK